MSERGYDGSINIDTRIDESGFNRGVQNIGRSLRTLRSSIKNTFSTMVLGLAKAAFALSGIVVVINQAIQFIGRMLRTMFAAMERVNSVTGRTKELKSAFEGLKGSMYNVFLPLLASMLPLIQRAVDWFTKLFNILAHVVAALTGQSTIMQVVASSADSAAGSTKDMAKNTKDAEKAAKGALAAFDDLNVLNMEKDSDDGSSGGSGGDGAINIVEIPVDNKIVKWINKVKEFLGPLKEPLEGLWDALKRVWDAAVIAFKPLSDWWDENGDGILETIRQLAIDGIEWLTGKLNDLADWIEENPDTFAELAFGLGLVAAGIALLAGPSIVTAVIFIAILLGLMILFSDELDTASTAAWQLLAILGMLPKLAWKWLTEQWGNFSTWFQENVWGPATTSAWQLLQIIGMSFQLAWNWVKSTWEKASEWFQKNVWGPATTSAWQLLQIIGMSFRLAFSGIKILAKNTINTVIDFLNSMIRGVSTGINTVIQGLNNIRVTIPSWVPVYGGNSWNLGLSTVDSPQIPRLATGAVIPPNSEFLAVLGDQRSGRNLEAPEGLIRQIIQEEIGSIDTNVTIEFGGSLGALVRELKPYIDKENTRVGRSLVKGALA